MAGSLLSHESTTQMQKVLLTPKHRHERLVSDAESGLQRIIYLISDQYAPISCTDVFCSTFVGFCIPLTSCSGAKSNRHRFCYAEERFRLGLNLPSIFIFTQQTTRRLSTDFNILTCRKVGKGCRTFCLGREGNKFSALKKELLKSCWKPSR